MIYQCTLKEFCQKYPSYGWTLTNLLSDPNYIVKFTKRKNGEIHTVEVGYKDDNWAIDKS